jgi:small-conductance mechanosensitive channel
MDISTQLTSFFPGISWEVLYFGNTLSEYMGAVIIFLGMIIVLGIVQRLALSRLKKWSKQTKTDIDDAFIRIIGTIKPPFYTFLAFYLGFSVLQFDGMIGKTVDVILIVWVTYQVVLAIQILIDYVLEKKVLVGDDKNKKSALRMLANIGKGALWGMGLLVVLSNLGVDITSLIAGLGIGGLAVAFALQNILEDLFSSFTIYFDKPFEAGDFIAVGSTVGTVQHIGVKSTRVRALSGEEIVVSNKELTSATIQNYKKMEKRRVVFTFGVTYETATDKMRDILKIVENIFSKMEKVSFDRVHFKSFDDSALTYEVVYHIQESDYNLYMDIQQEVNFQLKDIFEEKGISMAYPTQTIYMKKEE